MNEKVVYCQTPADYKDAVRIFDFYNIKLSTKATSNSAEEMFLVDTTKSFAKVVENKEQLKTLKSLEFLTPYQFEDYCQQKKLNC